MGIDSLHGELVLNLKSESLNFSLTLPGISLVIISQSLAYHKMKTLGIILRIK